LNECEGDCDGDYECRDPLICYHDQVPPGCSGTMDSSYYDYCGRPNGAHTVDGVMLVDSNLTDSDEFVEWMDSVDGMDSDYVENDGMSYDELPEKDASDEALVPVDGWTIDVDYDDLIMVLGVLLVALCAVNLAVMVYQRGKTQSVYSPVKFAAESDTEIEVGA